MINGFLEGFRIVCRPSAGCSTVWSQVKKTSLRSDGKVWPHLDDTVNTRPVSPAITRQTCAGCCLPRTKCVTTTEAANKLRASEGTGTHSSYAARKDFQGHELADFCRSSNEPRPIFSAVYPLIPADRVCSNSGEHEPENFMLMERWSAYDRSFSDYRRSQEVLTKHSAFTLLMFVFWVHRVHTNFQC